MTWGLEGGCCASQVLAAPAMGHGQLRPDGADDGKVSAEPTLFVRYRLAGRVFDAEFGEDEEVRIPSTKAQPVV